MGKSVVVDLAYEQFMKSLFGASEYHGYVGEVAFIAWRKDLVKVMRNLRRAILLTIHSDAHHTEVLTMECDLAMLQIGKSKTHQEASNAAIRYLAKIAFLLIGEYPDHYYKEHPTHNNYWALNHERQVGYTQSLRQKVELLRRLARQGCFEPELDAAACERKYHELEGKADVFLQWMKREHPAAYLRYL